ncbi:hypothetical protein MN116_008560 [Schistosoma mekongi]|uniref:GOLD domain-containing protein n=1 Tax=Schistosoma mekongi TaxID=38744 RepID=A0AAE1Z4U3_SCHME|nr:hypothetical protein MN116_008560 [Schistosoma mekongi]
MLLLVVYIFYRSDVSGSSLTFELEDRSSQCFYEEFANGSAFILEFSVLSGGNYDVDMTLTDPNNVIVKSDSRLYSDTVSVDDTVEGVYKACFSNDFSSVSHKVVSMTWRNSSDSSEDTAVPYGNTHISDSLHNLYSIVLKATSQQFENRVYLSRSYSSAIFLHNRVLYWSLGQAIVIVIFGICQILVLRSFFSSPSYQQSAKSVPMTTTGPLYTVGF